MDIGNILREARQARGLTLEQVEEETKIRRKYLEALENEAFHILPGRVYVRGFLRNYARFLGLDAEALVAPLEERFPLEETVSPPQPSPGPVKGQRINWPLRRFAYAAGGLALVFLLVWGVSWLLGSPRATAPRDNFSGKVKVYQNTTDSRSQGQRSSGEESAPSSGTETASSDAPKPAGVNLVLNVTDETCWMRVVVDGQTKFTGELAANQSKSFQAKERILVKLGNAGVVNVQLNGRDLGVLGGRGQVVNREFFASTQG